MRRVRGLPAMLAMAAAIAFVAGCTPWATYPAVEGATGTTNPLQPPIPDLMADSIAFVHAQAGWEGQIVYNLPEGASPHVYGRVTRRLGDARPMAEPGERAYHVRTVRLRSTEAEVDLIRPAADGTPQMVTLSFKQTLTGYEVRDERVWRFDVEEPMPHYAAADEPAPHVRQPATADATVPEPATNVETPTSAPAEPPAVTQGAEREGAPDSPSP